MFLKKMEGKPWNQGWMGGETYHLTFSLRDSAPHRGFHCKPLDPLSTCNDDMFLCYSIAVLSLSECVGVPNMCQTFIFLSSFALVGTVNSEIFQVP